MTATFPEEPRPELLEGDHVISGTLCGLEYLAKKEGKIPTADALWLIQTVRHKMAECVALQHAIQSSADILGDTLDRLDIPQKLLDDLEECLA